MEVMEFTTLKVYHVLAYKPQYDVSEPRVYAGEVKVIASLTDEQKLELAFGKAQNHHPDWCKNNVRSTMSGDMIELNNEYYIVQPIGFKKHEAADLKLH
jgi:hypothetical protein